MSGSPLRYIGDISREDAALLARSAAGARRILEFGAGASTQVLAQSAAEGAEIVTVETKPQWVERTRENLRLLGIPREVRFVPYRGFWRAVEGPFELIFDDGPDRLRAEFAERAWPMLAVGGCMLFHDTRRPRDARVALRQVERVFLEVASVQLNPEGSNLIVVRKQSPQKYVDWNVAEGRARWEYGHADPPPALWGDQTLDKK
jgi:predicted O-methyltransferase YrrM